MNQYSNCNRDIKNLFLKTIYYRAQQTAGNERPLKVIIDSNFLFIPFQFKVDVFEALLNALNQRFEPILLSTNLQELQAMMKRASPKLHRQTEGALKLAEKCRVVAVEKGANETNDEVILRVASLWKAPVATNDMELRRQLRAKNIPVIHLRGKNRLEIEGAV